MRRIVLLVLILICLPCTAFSGNVRVRAMVDNKSTIYLGDRFAYYIVIDGIREAGQVDLSPLSDFDPEFTGGQDYSQRSTTIINNKMTEKVKEQYIMTYTLGAVRAGQNRLPGVEVTVGGKVYRTNPVRFDVVEPQESDQLELEMVFAKSKCYEGEPVEVEIKWFIQESVAGAVEGVSFVVPFLRGGDFFIEKVNEVKAEKYPKRFLGLKVNGVSVPFSRKDVSRRGVNWVELGYKTIVIPKRPGITKVGPAMVFADLAVGKVVSRGFFDTRRENKRFAEQSDGAVIEVLKLPPFQGEDAFGGLVGKYTIDAEASPVNVDVGQPITLTIKVGQSRFLSPVQWPELEKIEGFAGNFKISSQRQDPVVEDGEKIFTTTIRAGNDSIKEIPSIPLHYFDTDKGEYVTAMSDAIPLDVSPSEVVTLADAQVRGSVSVNREVEAIKKGMSANFEDILLVSQDFSPVGALISPVYLLIWAVPLAAFVISGTVKIFTNVSEEKIAATRRRAARKKAAGMLKAAQSAEDAVAAMKEYAGWRFGKQAGAITAMDCERFISQATGDDEIAGEYRKIFEDCQAAYYTGGGSEFGDGEVRKIIDLIGVIDKKS